MYYVLLLFLTQLGIVWREWFNGRIGIQQHEIQTTNNKLSPDQTIYLGI